MDHSILIEWKHSTGEIEKESKYKKGRKERVRGSNL